MRRALIGLVVAGVVVLSGCDDSGADPCSVPNPNMQTQQACQDQQHNPTYWNQGYPSYGYGSYG